MQNKPPGWSPQTKLLVSFIILVCAAYLLYKFSEAIKPMVLAMILAFVLNPLVSSVQRRLRIKRSLAALLVFLALLAVLAAALALLMPLALDQLTKLVGAVEELLKQGEELFSGQMVILGFTVNGPDLLNLLLSSLRNTEKPLGSINILQLLTETFEIFIWVTFIIFIAFYMIVDSDKLMRWMERVILPAYRNDFVRIRDEINIIWSAFFRGQVLLSLIITAIVSLFCFAIGMPYALLLGIWAGVLEFLPSIGHSIWLMTASLVAFIAGSIWLPVPNWVLFLIVLAFYLFYTQFDLNYLIPRIIGRSVHLPQLVVLLGLIAGASLLGVIGVPLAAPTIASLRVIMRYINSRLFDEAFPDDIATPALPPPDLRWWQKRIVRHDPRD
ncbi:MAG: AI-2E family transporter [Anaerolineae bacterium]|nr:AI-2E family transporter [Anaerolineae bacterium]